AYPSGWQFTLGARLRKQRDGRHDVFGAWYRGELTDDVLRVGIALADGRKATIFDGMHHFPGGDIPEPEAVLRPNGGGGGGQVWECRFWAWPIPPEGPFAFV